MLLLPILVLVSTTSVSRATWVPDPLPAWSLLLDLESDIEARVNIDGPANLPSHLKKAVPEIRVKDITSMMPDDAELLIGGKLTAIPDHDKRTGSGDFSILNKKTEFGARAVAIDEKNQITAYVLMIDENIERMMTNWANVYRNRFGTPMLSKKYEGAKDSQLNQGEMRLVWTWGEKGSDDPDPSRSLTIVYKGGGTIVAGKERTRVDESLELYIMTWWNPR